MHLIMLHLWKLKTSGDILNEFLDIKDARGETYLSFNAANHHLQHFNVSGASIRTLEVLESVIKIAKLTADKEFRIQALKDPDVLIASAAKCGVHIEKRGLLCQS